MAALPQPMRTQDGLDQVFHARSVAKRGVIRRRVVDVYREIGRIVLELEVRRRGWHVLRSGAHYVILCQSDPFSVIC